MINGLRAVLIHRGLKRLQLFAGMANGLRAVLIHRGLKPLAIVQNGQAV